MWAFSFAFAESYKRKSYLCINKSIKTQKVSTTKQNPKANTPHIEIHRNAVSQNWTLDAVGRGLLEDNYLNTNEEAFKISWQQNVPLLNRNADNVLLLDYFGSKQLLASKNKVSLICHRADLTIFAQQQEAVLRAARNGWVVVTACVSPNERKIVQMLEAESLPLILVRDNGFHATYQPQVLARNACLANRRVEITPWLFRNQGHLKDDKGKNIPTITRDMCMIMNELVRVISRQPDDWWKK